MIFFRIHFNTFTWKRDACELIDYDCPTLIQDKFDINNSGYIIRDNNTVSFQDSPSESTTAEQLIEVKKTERIYQLLFNPFFIDETNYTLEGINIPWFIFHKTKIANNKPKKYLLKEGDIFKIGRIILKIREIKLNDNDENLNKNKPITPKVNITTADNLLLNSNTNHEKNKIKKKKVCRICYQDEETEENPLIQPCICSGTMKYIHYECLKQWISTQSCVRIDYNELCSIFLIKQIECELCKSKFPDYIKHNGKLFEIIDFHSYYKKYIVIESLILDNKKNKFLYVANLEKENINLRLGRGKDADLLLTDVSISRVHCVLVKEKNKLFLEDNNSKFGTLILIQCSNLDLCENLPINIQVGRTYFNILVKEKSSFFSCCNCSVKINENYYILQNHKKINYCSSIVIKDNDNNEEICSNDSKDNEIQKMKFDINRNYIEIKEKDNDEILETDRDDKNKRTRNNIKTIPFGTTETQA